MTAEARVGLLVITVGLLAVAVAVYLSGTLQDLRRYRITAQFSDVQGLQEGAPVRFGGVNIGRVTRVRLRHHEDYPGKPAAVTMTIEPEAILYDTDLFDVKQGALIGDKYLSVSRPPEVKMPRQRLASGDVIEGRMATSQEVIMDEVRELVGETRASIDRVTTLIADPQMHQDLRGTMSNLNRATAQALLIAEQTTRVVDTVARAGADSEQRIALIMANLIDASETMSTSMQRIDRLVATSPVFGQMATAGDNLRLASEDLAQIAASTREQMETSSIPEESEAAMVNIREATENLRAVSESARRLSDDEQMAADLRSSMDNVQRATDALRKASEQIEGLISDEEMQGDLRVTVQELRRTAEAGRGTMEQTQRVMADVEGTMETVRATQQIITDIEARPRFELRAIEAHGIRADGSFDVRPSARSKHFWRLGLRDIEGDGRLELQYAHELGDDLARVGLFGGELGIGYDWRRTRCSGLEADLYHLGNLKLDLRWRRSLHRDYDLLIGVDRTFSGTHPMLGVRYERDF